MPSHDVHCRHSLLRYGKSFSELHTWMDEPVRVLGPNHRLVRHDIMTTPQIAKLLFGEMADQVCIDHIILDFGGNGSKVDERDCAVVPSIRRKQVGNSNSSNMPESWKRRN